MYNRYADRFQAMPPKTVRKSNQERSESTRAKLVDAGRELFGSKGFQNVSTEEIVKRAKVTRGALYHHFGDKRDLFAAVAEIVEADSTERTAAAAAKAKEPWDFALLGARAFLDICLEPEFQQIVIVDAPAVLGQKELDDLADRYGGALIEAVLQGLIDQELMKPLPVKPLARMLTGALINGGLTIAQSDNQKKARKEVGDVVEALLKGLAT